MAKVLSHFLDRHPIFNKMDGGRMPQHMRTDVIQSSILSCGLEAALDAFNRPTCPFYHVVAQSPLAGLQQGCAGGPEHRDYRPAFVGGGDIRVA